MSDIIHLLPDSVANQIAAGEVIHEARASTGKLNGYYVTARSGTEYKASEIGKGYKVPLIGMLMFGNLIKEIGSDTSRLFDAAANSIMNAATIFLGLSVGATMTSEAFLNWTTIGIVIGGFLAFALSISGGIFFVKLFNLFSKKKINPLIGATGLSAVPMASRVCNEIATKYDPKNHVLNYCMSSNISGVIGSAVAAGVLISFLG